jgi:hypothetical protein
MCANVFIVDASMRESIDTFHWEKCDEIIVAESLEEHEWHTFVSRLCMLVDHSNVPSIMCMKITVGGASLAASDVDPDRMHLPILQALIETLGLQGIVHSLILEHVPAKFIGPLATRHAVYVSAFHVRCETGNEDLFTVSFDLTN